MRVSIDCVEKRFAVRCQIHPVCPPMACLTVNINSNGLDWRIITLRHALVSGSRFPIEPFRVSFHCGFLFFIRLDDVSFVVDVRDFVAADAAQNFLIGTVRVNLACRHVSPIDLSAICDLLAVEKFVCVFVEVLHFFALSGVRDVLSLSDALLYPMGHKFVNHFFSIFFNFFSQKSGDYPPPLA